MSNLDRWLEAPYEEMAERGHRFEQIKERYAAEAERDCTDAVLAVPEERVTSALIDLGNYARRLRTSGDTDDKIEFINYMCLRMDVIIGAYAKEQAEREMENQT